MRAHVRKGFDLAGLLNLAMEESGNKKPGNVPEKDGRELYKVPFGVEYSPPDKRSIDAWWGLIIPGRFKITLADIVLGSRDTMGRESEYQYPGHAYMPGTILSVADSILAGSANGITVDGGDSLEVDIDPVNGYYCVSSVSEYTNKRWISFDRDKVPAVLLPKWYVSEELAIAYVSIVEKLDGRYMGRLSRIVEWAYQVLDKTRRIDPDHMFRKDDPMLEKRQRVHSIKDNIYAIAYSRDAIRQIDDTLEYMADPGAYSRKWKPHHSMREVDINEIAAILCFR